MQRKSCTGCLSYLSADALYRPRDLEQWNPSTLESSNSVTWGPASQAVLPLGCWQLFIINCCLIFLSKLAVRDGALSAGKLQRCWLARIRAQQSVVHKQSSFQPVYRSMLAMEMAKGPAVHITDTLLRTHRQYHTRSLLCKRFLQCILENVCTAASRVNTLFFLHCEGHTELLHGIMTTSSRLALAPVMTT
jgi:hypothetical protein